MNNGDCATKELATLKGMQKKGGKSLGGGVRKDAAGGEDVDSC